MRNGFVYLDEAIPGVMWDAKYYTSDNFTGARVDGYEVGRVVGTRKMAYCLKDAQARANGMGLSLLLWDGYRPERAVRCFLDWVRAPEDGKTKEKHYPRISKADIVPLGYVAEKSSHSRGSAIDLTLYDPKTGQTLTMGGCFDLMDPSSHHGAKGIAGDAEENRELLKRIMTDSGFRPYDCEWWHYSLSDEPYPDTYFDFPIV